MADDPNYIHKAFICSSQSDRPWAEWLHGAMGSYAPKTAKRKQSVPKGLSSVFIDPSIKNDSEDLGDELVEVLFLAEYLVVVCSPHTAMSNWCNDAVRFFKYIGREDKIIHIVVSGEPFATNDGNVQFECFGLASRYKVDSEGQITDEPEDISFVEGRAGKADKEEALEDVVELIIGVDDVSVPAPPLQQAMVSTGMVDDEKAIERILDKSENKSSRGFPVLSVVSILLALGLAGLSAYLFVDKQNTESAADEIQTKLDLVQEQKSNVENERDDASDKLRDSLDLQGKLEKKNVDAELHRDRNKSLLIKALAAIDGISDSITEEGEFEGSAKDPIREVLLKDTFEYYEQFIKDASGNYDLAFELGNAQKRMGFYYWKNDNLGKAISILEAESKKEEKLLSKDPKNRIYMQSLAQSNYFLSKILSEQNKASQANEHVEKSIMLLTKLIGMDASNQAYARDLIAAYNEQTKILEKANMHKQAAASMNAQLSILEKMLLKKPTDKKLRLGLADNYRKLGKLSMNKGDFKSAVALFSKADKHYEKISRMEPKASDPLKKLSGVYQLMGKAYSGLSDHRNAAKVYNKDRSALKRLSAFNPSSQEYVFDLAKAHLNLGSSYNSLKDYEKAQDMYSKGLPFIQSLVQKNPSKSLYRDFKADLFLKMGESYRDSGNDAASAHAYKSAESEYSDLVQRSPDNINHYYNFISAGEALVESLLLMGNTEAAVDGQLKIISGYDQLLGLNAGDFNSVFNKAKVMDSVAMNYESLGRGEESLEWHKRSLEDKTNLKKMGFADKELSPSISTSLDNIRRMEGAVRDQLLIKLDNAGASSSVAGSVYQATDNDNIISKIGRVITVTGVVSSIQDQDEKFVINFVGIGPGGFRSLVPETRYEHFKSAYGENLIRLVGKSIAITGNLEKMMGNPFISVNQFDQLQIVSDGTPVAQVAPTAPRKNAASKLGFSRSPVKPVAKTPTKTLSESSRKPFAPRPPAVASAGKPRPPAPKPLAPKAPSMASASKPRPPAPKPLAPKTPSMASASKPKAPAPKPLAPKAPSMASASKPRPPAPKPLAPKAPSMASASTSTPSAPKAPSPSSFYKSKSSKPARSSSAASSTPTTTRPAPEPYEGFAPAPTVTSYSGENANIIFVTDQRTIKDSDGQSITVEGRVRSVILQDDLVALTFLGSSLTPVIEREALESSFNAKHSGDFLKHVKGKVLRVTGMIYLDQNIPRMSVESPKDVKIVGGL